MSELKNLPKNLTEQEARELTPEQAREFLIQKAKGDPELLNLSNNQEIRASISEPLEVGQGGGKLNGMLPGETVNAIASTPEGFVDPKIAEALKDPKAKMNLLLHQLQNKQGEGFDPNATTELLMKQ